MINSMSERHDREDFRKDLILDIAIVLVVERLRKSAYFSGADVDFGPICLDCTRDAKRIVDRLLRVLA